MGTTELSFYEGHVKVAPGPYLTSIEPARASHVRTRDRLYCRPAEQVADLAAAAAAALAAASTGVPKPVQSFPRQRSRSTSTLVEPPSSPDLDLDLERIFRARYCTAEVCYLWVSRCRWRAAGSFVNRDSRSKEEGATIPDSQSKPCPFQATKLNANTVSESAPFWSWRSGVKAATYPSTTPMESRLLDRHLSCNRQMC